MGRVLVIEDDPGHRLVLKSRLSDAGHEVVVAESGAKGLLDARSQPFDVFLVAARLGSGVDGFEVCRRLKSIPERARVPIVLFNDQSGVHEDLGRGYDAGCDAFVTRADLPALEHVLRVLATQKRRMDEIIDLLHATQDSLRRLQDERARGGSENSQRETIDVATALREIASPRPDGLLVVDDEGTVRLADRGACDLLGSRIEGQHLGSLVPASGLEAFARDARIEPREGFRFDVPGHTGRSSRSLTATVMPLLLKPTEQSPLLRVVILQDAQKRRLALERLRLPEQRIPHAELGPLTDAAREVYRPESLLGVSAAVSRLRETVAAAAENSDPVLLRGARGTGAEFVSRILHFGGSSTGAYVTVRCGAHLPENLEFELFGCSKQANGGVDRPGALHLAQDGTLFLADVHELPAELQTRVLRFLESGTIQRRGATKQERLDVRIVAGSSAEMEQMLEDNRFSRELYERLAKNLILLPSLASRREDLDVLVRHFVERHGARRHVTGINDDVYALFWRLEWPGNLADLEDAVDHACARATHEKIGLEDLPRALRDTKSKGQRDVIPSRPASDRAVEGTHSVSGPPGHELIPRPMIGGQAREVRNYDITDEDAISFDVYERKVILRALKAVNDDKIAAAKLLKVGKSTLYRKLKRYDIK